MRGLATRSEECGLIGFHAEDLTRSDGRMKVRLKVLPDEPRGGAWPTPARAVKFAFNIPLDRSVFSENQIRYRCHVKSCNEQDPHPFLPAGPTG